MTVTTAVSTGNIAAIVGYACIAIAAFIVVGHMLCRGAYGSYAESIAIPFTALIFVLIGMTCISIGRSNAVANKDLSGYTVYIDGQEVDSDKIDASLYNITFDDENGVAYATRK